MTKINTILQCFVDLNLDTDENSTFSLDLPKISFTQATYNVDEGSSVNVVISLSEPSPSGLEEVEVGVITNNTSTLDFNTNGQSYPQTLTFSAGQQTQILTFNANTDLFEEGTESFDVILSFFTNTVPGQYITTTVNIIDLTDLKEVFINEQGGVLVPATTQDPAYINFSVIEGASKNIKISLDSPSVLGVESVQVQLTSLSTTSNDYVTNTTVFSWAPGEQHKTLQITALSDDLIEDSEFLKIQLVNSVNSNIISPSEAVLEIIDNSPKFFYANFNMQGSYIQYGGGDPSVEARWVKENAKGLSVESGQQKRFLKFGHGIEKAYTEFNTPNGSSQGYGYSAGGNIIVGYNPSLPTSLQHNNVIFFGGKPAVNFGVGNINTIIKNDEPKTYGDLRLRITNAGTHPALISGSTITAGDFITTIVDRFDYNITLPTNNGLLSAGTTFQGTILSQDTLTQCLYNFTFEVDFEEVGFKLRDNFNSVSSNKEINIGTHLVTEVHALAEAALPQNKHNLVTQVNNVWPFWESNFSFPQNAPHCMAGGTLANNLPTYPTNTDDLKRVLIDGMVFLHQDVTNENSTSTTKTMYENFVFLPSGQTASSSGCTGVDIEYPPIIGSNAPYTASIPFKII